MRDYLSRKFWSGRKNGPGTKISRIKLIGPALEILVRIAYNTSRHESTKCTPLILDPAQHIRQAQLKQKEAYDKKHAAPERFQVDCLVLKKDFTRKKVKGGKLKNHYVGPYVITKALPHGVYELVDLKNKEVTL